MKNWLTLITVGAICIFASCAQPKPLVYKNVQNFRIRLLKQPPLALNVKFFNPNPYPLTFKSADIAVFINGNHLGNMVLDSVFQVPALDSFLLPVGLNVDLRNVFPSAARLIFDSSVMVKLDGKVKVGAKRVYINVPLRYEGEQALDVPRLLLNDKIRH